MSTPVLSNNFHEHKERHIMLDLETLGVTPGSVICSLAAVEFDIQTGQTLKTFYERIGIQSCLDSGLTVTGDTLTWWMQQSRAARVEVYGDNRKPLRDVLNGFSNFLQSIDGDRRNLRIYGNSSDFDCSILASAYQAMKLPIPWMFYGTRCVRTISSLFPEIKKSTKFEGTLHNPLDDCLHQVKYLCATIKKLQTI